MLQTVEAMIDADGKIEWLESFKIERPTKVLVTLLGADKSKEAASASVEDAFGMLKAKRPANIDDMDAAIRKRGGEF